MKYLRNLVLLRANKTILDQETDNTETSNQIEISAESFSKQQNKEKTNQRLKRPLQIELQEISEVKTHGELDQVTGQIDPLNLVSNQIRKSNDKETAEKNEKFKLKPLIKKVPGYKTSLT